METEPVVTNIVIDDREARRKFDDYEKSIKKVESSGKRAGKGLGAFGAAAIGGAAGFVAGAVRNNPATSAISDLLINIIAAALLPAMVALLPVLQSLGGVLDPMVKAVAKITDVLIQNFGSSVIGGAAAGAYVGGKIAGPAGAAVGGVVGGVAAGDNNGQIGGRVGSSLVAPKPGHVFTGDHAHNTALEDFFGGLLDSFPPISIAKLWGSEFI